MLSGSATVAMASARSRMRFVHSAAGGVGGFYARAALVFGTLLLMFFSEDMSGLLRMAIAGRTGQGTFQNQRTDSKRAHAGTGSICCQAHSWSKCRIMCY